MVDEPGPRLEVIKATLIRLVGKDGSAALCECTRNDELGLF